MEKDEQKFITFFTSPDYNTRGRINRLELLLEEAIENGKHTLKRPPNHLNR